MEEVKTGNRLSELHENGVGFLFNDVRHDNSYGVWGTLHKANCQWLTKMNINDRWSTKYWFPTREEARRWIHKQYDFKGRKSRDCIACNP